MTGEEIILPALGASIALGTYAWKKDTEIKEGLETAYGKLVKRTDLNPKAIERYMEEIKSFRGGLRTFFKKREYISAFNKRLKELENEASSDLEIILPQEVCYAKQE
jgi:hypothetical protein